MVAPAGCNSGQNVSTCDKREAKSDADGTRTRNHRIDSLSLHGDLEREKPANDDVSESCLRTGLRKVCDAEIQTWLNACPVSLPNVVQVTIKTLVNNC